MNLPFYMEEVHSAFIFWGNNVSFDYALGLVLYCCCCLGFGAVLFVSWFNSRWQLSITQMLANSFLAWGRESEG